MTELFQKAITYTEESYQNCFHLFGIFAILFLVFYIICVIHRYKRGVLGVCASFLMLIIASGISGRSALLIFRRDLQDNQKAMKEQADYIIIEAFGGEESLTDMKYSLSSFGIDMANLTELEHLDNIEKEVTHFLGYMQSEYEKNRSP